jgi:MOSC domain-containing protein
MRRIHEAMRVTQLWRYPVKSMRGEVLKSTHFGHGGIPFDRRFALVDDTPESLRRGLQTTARQIPALLGYAASVADGSVVVQTPDGAVMDVTQPGAAERLAKDTGLRFALADDPAGANHDAADVLVINEASVRQFAAEWGHHIDLRRFRANVVIDGSAAFDEETWVGRKLRVGGAVLDVFSSCGRCVITTLDPETLVADPAFLKEMTQRHRTLFGVYCAVSKPGDAGLGDECSLLPLEA